MATTAFLEQYQTESEELEKENEEMQDKLEKLEKENKTLNIEFSKLTVLDRVIKIDFNYLEDFEPTQIKSLINLIISIQRQVADESLTIRVIEGIAHRDGAIRSLGILKTVLQKMLKDIKNKPKKED